MDHNTSRESRVKAQPACDPEEKKTIVGVVTDCLRLNLREKPDPGATVLMVIPASTEVTIDLEASTDKFYRVCTAAGVEGFCMRKYITIRE